MIKVGDYIRMKDYLKDKYWYTEEVYQVMSVHNVLGRNTIGLTLDRPFPSNMEKQWTKIFMEDVYVDVKYTRMQKLKRIFND